MYRTTGNTVSIFGQNLIPTGRAETCISTAANSSVIKSAISNGNMCVFVTIIKKNSIWITSHFGPYKNTQSKLELGQFEPK